MKFGRKVSRSPLLKIPNLKKLQMKFRLPPNKSSAPEQFVKNIWTTIPSHPDNIVDFRCNIEFLVIFENVEIWPFSEIAFFTG